MNPVSRIKSQYRSACLPRTLARVRLPTVADKPVSKARADLLVAARRFRAARSAMDRSRDQLHAAIVTAVASGETKSQVARDTGYTREYVTELVNRDAAKRAGADA